VATRLPTGTLTRGVVIARVLVIGDIHEPASHPGYKAFVSDLYETWACDRVVFIGDVLDHHCISFHAHDVLADGVTRETDLALERVADWVKLFKRADVMIGNHDERVFRLAASVSIPSRFIKGYAAMWNTPHWKWQRDTTIDNVHYFHGTGCSGQSPAITAARASMQNTVIGHCHSQAGIRWAAGPDRKVFGMDTGCGVDVEHPAMSYGRDMIRRPILSAGVVIDGVPYHEIMPLARGEPYHRSRFE